MFPRIYTDEKCPIAGYDGYTLRVLANPTAQEKKDWWGGSTGTPGCRECAELRTSSDDSAAYCPACTALRTQLGQAAVSIFGTSRCQGLDFSTPESALASFAQPELPDEFVGWLWNAPNALWVRRIEDMKKKLAIS